MDVHLIAPHQRHEPMLATFHLEAGAAQWRKCTGCLSASNSGRCSG